jgi:hypothetical protein
MGPSFLLSEGRRTAPLLSPRACDLQCAWAADLGIVNFTVFDCPG